MYEESASLGALPPPLDSDKAVELDEQIRTMADKAGQHLEYLTDLLKEAKEGQVHRALQFDSWTAYLADRLKPVVKQLDPGGRRELVAMLHEAGMSVRAIAEAVDLSKSTAQRQVSQSGTATSETTGLDDKTYPRRNNGAYRGRLKPDMRLSRAVKTIAGIDPAMAEDQAALRQQLEVTRKLIDEAIHRHLETLNGLSSAGHANTVV